ncbi:MAG: hypothetical protein ASARMPRED_006094 [Alectoria sarmentosa]|nr:MAG: hypothetical protein ASARMPRED_006094 [Alectoria sarmentosa]
MKGAQDMNGLVGPPPPESANAETRLKGHIGHLTQQEESAFDDFKKLCAKKGYYTPHTANGRASHDDGTLIRFLRARKFVPQDAFTQFKDTEIWRKKYELDELYENIDIHEYQAMRQFYPQWTGRRDKRGIPVYVYEIGKLDPKKITAYASAPSKSKTKSPGLRLFALYENLTRFVMPLCSAVPGRSNPETPVDQSNNIVDISKVGLKQFWSLRSHMQEASTLATAHYPEVLDRIFVIGAPSFFPVVWGWVKKWFDPITTSKIFVLAQQDVLPTLSSFIDVDNIPKKYGGKLDFTYGKLPSLDPDIRQHLSIEPTRDAETLFIASPIRWIDAGENGEDGEITALSVGTLDGKPRKERVAVLHALATRVATHSSNFQSQRTETTTLPSRPATSNGEPAPLNAPLPNGHTAPPNGTAFLGEAPSQSYPVSNGQSNLKGRPTSTQPAPVTNRSTASLHTQSIPSGGPLQQHPVTNGALPESKPHTITMPPRQNNMVRTKTDFFTPPSDPAEMKQLQ